MQEVPQDIDGRAICPHEDAVKWNPWNKVVQCHRCGEQFAPISRIDAVVDYATEQMATLAQRIQAIENLPGVREALDANS